MLSSLTEVVAYGISSNAFCQDTSTERDHTCVMSIQLFWNVMLFCCAFIFPCKSNCCKLSFSFTSLIFFLSLTEKKQFSFIAQLSFLDAVCDPGISRTNYLKPHVKQCCYLDSPWYYNIVTYTNRNLALYGCLYICIIYIYTCVYIWYIYVNGKWSPRTEGKKKNLFCIPTLKPKGLLLKLYNGIVLDIYKEKVFLEKCFLY